jgi:hypothetical protein
MPNESTPINAALDSDASQFFVSIRIRLLELGFWDFARAHFLSERWRKA